MVKERTSKLYEALRNIPRYLNRLTLTVERQKTERRGGGSERPEKKDKDTDYRRRLGK